MWETIAPSTVNIGSTIPYICPSHGNKWMWASSGHNRNAISVVVCAFLYMAQEINHLCLALNNIPESWIGTTAIRLLVRHNPDALRRISMGTDARAPSGYWRSSAVWLPSLERCLVTDARAPSGYRRSSDVWLPTLELLLVTDARAPSGYRRSSAVWLPTFKRCLVTDDRAPSVYRRDSLVHNSRIRSMQFYVMMTLTSMWVCIIK